MIDDSCRVILKKLIERYYNFKTFQHCTAVPDILLTLLMKLDLPTLGKLNAE
jgi:hypothetical protein